MATVNVTIDGHTYEVDVDLHRRAGNALTVRVDGEELQVSIPDPDHPAHMEWFMIDNRPYEIVLDKQLRWIKSYNGLHLVEARDSEVAAARPVSGDGRVKAPIPGQISRVMVEVGDTVEAGQPIVIVEAMKMENEIRAPRPGTVSAVHVVPGQNVQLQVVMIEIA